MVVNQQELARCLGLTARQVRNLRKDYGMFPNDDNKKYALEECIQEYIRFKIEEETGRRSNISKEKVSAEHEEVKKQISLLKLKKLKAELHLAKDVERYLTGMLLAFKAKLEGLPTKMAMQVAGMTDVNEKHLMNYQSMTHKRLMEKSPLWKILKKRKGRMKR